jgi:uncharacterized protein
MILIDANLLIYAYDESSPFHQRSKEWLGDVFEREPVIGLPWISILAFLRLTTSSVARFAQPLDLAAAIVDDWLARPNVRTVGPGERHWDILKRVAADGQARGPLLTDAALAALAIEYGATLYTADRGFARFAGLRFVNPLAG